MFIRIFSLSLFVAVINARFCHGFAPLVVASKANFARKSPARQVITGPLQMSTSDDMPPLPPILANTVTLKVAVDAQGAAADLSAVKSERFTGPPALDMVHRLRRDCDCVVVGKATVVDDNPSLTIRRVRVRENSNIPDNDNQPLRVVLDPRLSLIQDGQPEYTIFYDGYKTVLYHGVDDTDSVNSSMQACIQKLPATVTVVKVPLVPAQDNSDSSNSNSNSNSSRNVLCVQSIVDDLYNNRSVKHIMVEGGPRTAQAFLQAGLVDRAIMVHANTVTFAKPYMAGLDAEYLQKVGKLQRLGDTMCGDDEFVYWSRPELEWPCNPLTSWP